MSNIDNEWYILRANDSLRTKRRCTELIPLYRFSRNSLTFDIELCAPLEFSEHEDDKKRRSIKGLSINYMFARGDVKKIDDFSFFCRNNGVEMRLLNRERSNTGEVSASKISDAELKSFMDFCEGYHKFCTSETINFIDIDDNMTASGDVVKIINGICKGQDARIDENQNGVADNHVRVIVYWFGCVGVPTELPKEDLEFVRKAKYANSKYAAYDEFFDYILSNSNYSRLRGGGCNPSDIAKALYMRKLAEPYATVTKRHERSLRLQILNSAALIATYHILKEKKKLQEQKEVWDRLLARVKNPKDYNIQTKVADIATQE